MIKTILIFILCVSGHITSYTIPVLPASPYRVNSPNAESLWPEGLFIPPSLPVQYNTRGNTGAHFHNINFESGNHILFIGDFNLTFLYMYNVLYFKYIDVDMHADVQLYLQCQ